MCGTQGNRDLRAMPYQYVFNPFDPETTRRCVAACPDQWFSLICQYDVTPPDSSDLIAQQKAIANGTCFYTYRSSPVLNRCVPSSDILTKMGNSSQPIAEAQNIAAQVFQDLYNSWMIIIM